MKLYLVVVFVRLVLDRWVERVKEPTAVCVFGYDRFPLGGEPLGLALWEARISVVRTMGCGVMHLLTPCDFGLRIVLWIP